MGVSYGSCSFCYHCGWFLVYTDSDRYGGVTMILLKISVGAVFFYYLAKCTMFTIGIIGLILNLM
jgi:hypothetical protein